MHSKQFLYFNNNLLLFDVTRAETGIFTVNILKKLIEEESSK